MANIKFNKQEIMSCPKCKSEDIRMNIPDAFSASIGSHPGWRCENCGLKLPEFPLREKIKNKKIN